VRDQFLVEVADTSTAELTAAQTTPATALLQLNALFTAWIESVYHHQVHSETGQTPLTRWNDGFDRLGHGPIMASAQALTEAFLWSEYRTVTKTATVSLHGNTYQVEAALAGRKVELVFSPFNLKVIEVRHAHPKARPETPEPTPAPVTGIAYLQLVANLALDGQRLPVVLQRPLLLAQAGVHETDVVQGGGLAGPVADLALDGQRLPVVLQRPLLLAQPGVHVTDVVQGGGLVPAVVAGAVQA
jgi:hypothetical protein